MMCYKKLVKKIHFYKIVILLTRAVSHSFRVILLLLFENRLAFQYYIIYNKIYK